MFSSEQEFLVNGRGKDSFIKTIDLALFMSGNSVSSYLMKDDMIVFYWFNQDGLSRLPKTKNPETIANLAWDFLGDEEVLKFHKDNNPQDDIDGSVDVGWEIFLPSWRDEVKVDHNFYSIFAVRLTWLYYHK